MRKLTGVIFDLEGTLTDPGSGIIASVRRVLATLDLRMPPRSELGWCVGPPLREIFARLLEPAGKGELVEQAAALYLRNYAQAGAVESTVYKGVVEMLAELREGTGGVEVAAGPRALTADLRAGTAEERRPTGSREGTESVGVGAGAPEATGGFGVAEALREAVTGVGAAKGLLRARKEADGAGAGPRALTADLRAGTAEERRLTGSRGGMRLYVVTSKNTAAAERILLQCGLRQYFERVLGNGRLDDKSDLVGELIESERLDRRAVAMVGDREHDIRAGKRNGLFTIGVAYGYGSRGELAAAGADRICDAPGDVERVLLFE